MDVPVKSSKGVGMKRSRQQSKSDSAFLIKSDTTLPKASCDSPLTRLSQVELVQYCPKKLFYIVFLAETDQDSASLLDHFKELSRSYEEVSSVTFISREDVFDMLDTSENYIFPNQLRPLLLDVIESIKQFDTNTVSPIYEAQMLKLKLVQVMYQQYVAQVKKNQREKNLEDVLNVLSKECKKKQKKDENAKDLSSPDKNKSPRREEGKQKNKKDGKAVQEEIKDEEIDYTSIPVDGDGISFEENLFEYIWFYCIKGFHNNEIFHICIELLNIPICAIIKVIDVQIDTFNIPDNIVSFWKNIELHFFNNTNQYHYLEDTVLMQFTSSEKFNTSNIIELFQEFVFVLRRIIDLKLSHLKYLRYLTINRIKNMYAVVPVDCMQVYNKSLNYFPLEYISSILILNAILKEVYYNLNSNPATKTPSVRSLSLSRSSVKSFHSIQCIDPLHDFQAFSNSKSKTSISGNIGNDFNSFLLHEKNELLKILKFNKHVGPRMHDITLNFVKRIPVLKNIQQKLESNVEDIVHTHDKDPSTKFTMDNNEILDNFLYLFLFSTFSNNADVPLSVNMPNLTNNLITFDVFNYWTSLQQKFKTETVENDTNLYDTSLVYFRWKEKLSSEVLIQEVFEATNDFCYVDQKYSPETDNFLVVFSNKLDEFGLNSRIFNEIVRTPICLRDFSRYTTVNETDWLYKNEIKIINENTFKISLDEVCPGAHKVKTQLKLFQEYSYLLNPNNKEEDDDTLLKDRENDEDTLLEEIKLSDTNFTDVLTDLQKYPLHKNLLQECESATETQRLLSYDLGTNLFKVTGHITTFCSHDGVKVTVDNTRFLQSPVKCTVNLFSNQNTMTLHSSEMLKMEPYIFSMLLKDGSRISFEIKRQNESVDIKENSDLEKISEEKEVEIEKITYEVSEISNHEQEEVETNIDQVVHCVDENFLKHLLGNETVFNDLYASEDSEELLDSVLNARENNGVIYKINRNSNYLRRLHNDLQVPVEHALRNILPRKNLVPNIPKSYTTCTKLFRSASSDKSDLDIKSSVDFRICLPNGLFIKAHTCVINQNSFMIKQEYIKNKPNIASVQHEEFRLFNCLGYVFIKKVDGTVTILKANGDIIDFEKPSDGSGEESSLKPCHCSTLDDYRNKLNKMLKEEQHTDYSTSRRGHITNKQNHILDKKLLRLLENFDVPYLKKSITRFDGKKIKIQGDKITQKQLYHMTSQQDFFTEEIFFERNDNFRSTFERNGSQKIVFPDGTIISNSVNIADELIDDFVYVTLSFRYDHPNYATVTYDFDKTLEIILNNEVVLKKRLPEDKFTINLQNDTVSVSNEQVLFEKTCENCLGSFKCNFNIKPFYENSWDPLQEFFHLQDTYEKLFCSDFIGNCSKNVQYIKGRLNSLKCNHYKKCNYTKMFVIEKDFSGTVFCNNDMVTNKIKEMQSSPGATVQTYNMLSNKTIKVVDCRQKNYLNYCYRFFNNTVQEYLDRILKHKNQQKELYTTFRTFHKMFNSVEEIEQHVTNLRQAYFSEFVDLFGSEVIFKSITSLKDDIEMYVTSYKMEMLDEQEELERKRKDAEEEALRQKNAKCLCIKQRITMAEKISNWKKTCRTYRKKIKNRDFPSYFNSDFCKILE